MTGAPGRRRIGPLEVSAALAALAAVAVLALQAVAIRDQWLTADEPYHLLAGWQALRQGENTLNLEHPPLVKLVAALPLLAEPEPLAPRLHAGEALAATQALFRTPELAARARLRGRVLVALAFGLPFLAACFALGREAGGPRAGVVLALSVGASFSVLPHLPLVTTDAAVALGYAATLVAVARFLRAPGAGTAAVLGLGLGLAMAAKHSGLLLVPSVLLAVALARPPAGAQAGSLRQRLGWTAAAAAVALALVLATYALANRRYDPARGRESIHRYATHQSTLLVDDRMRPYEPSLLALERLSPGLAQWATGVVGVQIQNSIGVYPSYAFGEIRSRGRWWYFPVLLLVKTPVTLLAASIVGAAVAVSGRRRRAGHPPPGPPGPVPRADPARTSFRIVLWVTALVYLGMAIASNYNLGYRHLLPVLPLLFLPAAFWASRRTWRAAALVGLLLTESIAVAPLWISATNTWWLGAGNPTRFALSGDNGEWRQNLLALGEEARERGMEPLRLLYPTSSPAEVAAAIPGAIAVTPGSPLPPGWYAVSTVLEQLVPAIEAASPATMYGHHRYLGLAQIWRPVWEEVVQRGEDHGYAAGTFHLYRLDGAAAP